MGLDYNREDVGDRFLMQRIRHEAGILGGEPSGHVLCLDKTTTGDGLVAALQVLSAMNDEELSLQELGQGMQVYPQTMINVPVPQILRQHDMQAVSGLAREAEQQLNGNGRVLLRPSGTEPLVRIMVEGEDRQLIEDVARHLAEKVAAAL